MSVLAYLRQGWFDFLSAIQFLTRIPVPALPYEEEALSRSVKFFPLIGLLIGSGGALLHFLLAPHLPRLITALAIVLYFVLITGSLHEDGLADAADGFGEGRDREKILAIMRDSRIGVYGATALTMSLLARVLLIASLPTTRTGTYLMLAQVLSRTTTLPLSFYLSPARDRTKGQIDGQGARIARLTTLPSFICGTVFTLAVVFYLTGIHGLIPAFWAAGTTLLTALYYKARINGVTGDCFGATNQLTEIAVYSCGVWV